MSADLITTQDRQYENIRLVCERLLGTANEVMAGIEALVAEDEAGALEWTAGLEQARELCREANEMFGRLPEKSEDIRSAYTMKNLLNKVNLVGLVLLAKLSKAKMLRLTDGDEINFKRRLWSYETIMAESEVILAKVDDLRNKETRELIIRHIGVLSKLVTWFDYEAPYGRCATCGEPLKKAKKPGVYYKYCFEHRPDTGGEARVVVTLEPAMPVEEPLAVRVTAARNPVPDIPVDRSGKSDGRNRKKKAKSHQPEAEGRQRYRKGHHPRHDVEED